MKRKSKTLSWESIIFFFFFYLLFLKSLFFFWSEQKKRREITDRFEGKQNRKIIGSMYPIMFNTCTDEQNKQYNTEDFFFFFFVKTNVFKVFCLKLFRHAWLYATCIQMYVSIDVCMYVCIMAIKLKFFFFLHFKIEHEPLYYVFFFFFFLFWFYFG